MTHSDVYTLLRRLGLSESVAETGELLARPLRAALVVVAAAVLARLGSRAARRFARGLHARRPRSAGSARAEQRATTVGDALGRAVRVVVWTVAVMLVLSEVGVDLAPLIAGAGIAGVALGFGAQSLVKDFLSGLFILLEDQYGVGDVVDLGGESAGTVEEVSLRVTRLRAVDGTVWFVPNGEIRKVGNSSMEWSRAVIDVLVPYDTDLEQVKRLVSEEAAAFAADDTWGADVLEPPELWGVQAMGPDGITLRLVVKTAPRKQYTVARELRGRISGRLRREGVRGPGRTLLVSAGDLDRGTPPPPPQE